MFVPRCLCQPVSSFQIVYFTLRFFWDSYYVTCTQVICELNVLSSVGCNEVQMRVVPQEETGRRPYFQISHQESWNETYSDVENNIYYTDN